MDRPTDLRREFITCLIVMLFFAMGGGSFLLLIVGYQETHGATVTEIGSVMSLHSIVEGTVCLLVGHLYRGKWTREILLGALVISVASSLLMAPQPWDVRVWLAAVLMGAAFGVFTVIMYVAALQRRPPSLNLGLAVGLYTATIAGGNGLGALLGGWLTDLFSFTVSFLFNVACFSVAFLGTLTLSRRFVQPEAQPEAVEEGETASRPAVWPVALLSAFILSSTNMAYDILFPVYSLRTGLNFTLIGTFSGAKMVLAAVVRPFAGHMMSRRHPVRLNNLSLAGLAGGTALIPFAGSGFGLMAVIAWMGVTFGSARTTSATLAVRDETRPQVVSRRVSYYNTMLTLGQTLSPWFVGVIADKVDVTVALVIAPLTYIGLFGLGLLGLKWFTARRLNLSARRSQG
ncbi:MAG TPA: MFS transporter [Chloroflexi bacterium]|nr:MFS transporter [Chloroflexota bacterium]